MVFIFETQKQVQVFAISLVFSLMAMTAVALRIVSQRIKGARLNLSDYLIMCALAACIATSVCCVMGVFAGGLGRHSKDISFEEDRFTRLITFPATVLWALSLGCTKTSLCFLYISIFPLRRLRHTSYIVMVASVVFALITILGNILICLPVNATWDVNVKATCGNQNAAWVVIGVLNICTDILVLCLPISTVWRLQIRKQRKILLSFIFGLGSLVCIISIIRVKFLLDVQFDSDFSYTMADAAYWSYLEPSLAVTTACLPTLGPLLSRIPGFTNSRPLYSPKAGLRTFGRSHQRRNYQRTDDSVMLTSAAKPNDKTEENIQNDSMEAPDVEAGQRTNETLVRNEWDVHYN